MICFIFMNVGKTTTFPTPSMSYSPRVNKSPISWMLPWMWISSLLTVDTDQEDQKTVYECTEKLFYPHHVRIWLYPYWKSRSFSFLIGYISWFSWKYTIFLVRDRSERNATSSARFSTQLANTTLQEKIKNKNKKKEENV